MKTHGQAAVFQVSGLDRALRYYKDVLGFKEDFRFEKFAGISHGDVCIHLCAHDFHQRPVGGGSVSIFCDEVDAYYRELQRKGAVVKAVPEDRWYGMRDFTVLDSDGNHLHFGSESRKSASPNSR